MQTRTILLSFTCLVVLMAPSSLAGDVAAGLVKLNECCPSMPVLVNESFVNACMASKDKKPGFSMFGGSVEKNRSCVLECAFKADNLLMTLANGSQTVDLSAVEARLAMKTTTGKWSGVLNITKLNCTSKPPVILKSSVTQKCSSGAYELSTCIYKNLMSTCPEKIATADCTKRITSFSMSLIQKIKSVFKKKNKAAPTEATPAPSP